jgi:hypothetical protein
LHVLDLGAVLAQNAVELGHVGLDAVNAPFHVHEARLHLGIELVDAQIKPLQPTLVQQNPEKDRENGNPDGDDVVYVRLSYAVSS